MLRSANKYRCEFFDSTALSFTLKIKVLGAEKTILFVLFFVRYHIQRSLLSISVIKHCKQRCFCLLFTNSCEDNALSLRAESGSGGFVLGFTLSFFRFPRFTQASRRRHPGQSLNVDYNQNF